MNYLVGLGNPGKRYERSRHNIGFMFLDAYARKFCAGEWKPALDGSADVLQCGSALLVKPQRYMNTSGEALLSALRYFDEKFKSKFDCGKLEEIPNLYVCYDDLDMELGNYKLQYGTHPKIHNGVNSILRVLGTAKFWHVRIGSDTRNGNRAIPPEDFVLMKMSAEECKKLEVLFPSMLQQLHAALCPS